MPLTCTFIVLNAANESSQVVKVKPNNKKTKKQRKQEWEAKFGDSSAAQMKQIEIIKP